MKISNFLLMPVFLCTAFSSVVLAQTAPSFGASQSFAVLGSSTVTNTGSTVITGNVGVSPGSAVTGFPPATNITGLIYSGAPSIAGSAQISATAVYNNLAAQTTTKDLTGQDLGG